MPNTSALASSLAFFQELAQGTAPANAAAWVTAVGSLATGARIRHLAESLSTDGFKQATAEDMRSQENVQDIELKIPAIKGGTEFGFEVYLTGTGAVTAAASQVAATALSTLLLHCMGGAHRSNSTTISGGTSSTVFDVASTTNIVLGCYIGIEFAADPGRVHDRRVVGIDGLELTVDVALPATPGATDIVHGKITCHFDEDVLEDSAVGPTTLAWLISKGRGSAREHWVARGCKSFVEAVALSRNDAPKLSIKTLVASFATPDENTDPTWTADPEGFAPVAVGPDTQVTLQDYGTTANALRHALELSVSPGGQPEPCETLTENDVGMPGRSHYGLAKDETTASLHTLMLNSDWGEFDDGQFKLLRWSRIAPAGRCVSIALHRAEITETPTSAPAGPSLGHKLAFRGHRDTDDVATTDLMRSRFVIVLG